MSRDQLWRKLSTEVLMLFELWCWRRLLRVPQTARRSTSPSWRSVLGVHWKDGCWGWNSNTLATWCKELTHWKRPWCWEGLGEGGEGDDRGWDSWMASPSWCAWVWVNSRSWWWTGMSGMLRFIGLQIVRHDWLIELNWTVDRDSSPEILLTITRNQDFLVNGWFLV